MPTIQLSTNTRNFFQGFTTNSTATGTTPVVTTPSVATTDGIVLVKDANLAKLLFYGALTGAGDADGRTMTDTRVYTWSEVAQDTWVPTLVGAFNMTLGGAVGVAGGVVIATEYFAETITLVDGDESCRIISGIADDIGSLTIDLEGAYYLQVVFHNAPGTADADTRNFLCATF
jgi:hypothetical protein